jgi:adenylate cyclase
MEMSRFTLFRLKNVMLISNFTSNAIGVAITNFLGHRSGLPDSLGLVDYNHRLQMVFTPIAFAIPFTLNLFYERPIRRYLNNLFKGQEVSESVRAAVQQRLLNEPFVLIAINTVIWLGATVFWPTAYWLGGFGGTHIKGALFLTLQGGLITVTVAFFVLEFFLQYRLSPVIFPKGGLSRTPNTFRIRIRTRLIAFLLACNLIPLFGLVRSVWTTMNNTNDMALAAQVLYQSVLVNAFIYVVVGIWVTFLVSGILTRSISGMVPALKAVREGRFDTTVRVTSNDELGYAGDVINEMTAGLREREFIKEAFGKYVSREIRDEILAQRIPLDGELKMVTVLFADLRNFTPLVERTSPKAVVQIINSYFEEMEKIIAAHRGLILQFIGDEIEAVFGAPIAMENHPDMALQAAMAMHHQLDKVNRSLMQDGQPVLSHGIGIHTGEVVAANIGSPQRLSYALVGDTVNVAARLQDLNKQFNTHIIASGVTMARVTGDYPLQALPATHIKGKSKEIALFGV